jgi:hypothetical protein
MHPSCRSIDLVAGPLADLDLRRNVLQLADRLAHLPRPDVEPCGRVAVLVWLGFSRNEMNASSTRLSGHRRSGHRANERRSTVKSHR